MKFLLLNGGGMDSLAVAKIARDQYPAAEIMSVHYCYGLPSEPRTVVSAKAIADAYCTSHQEYRVSEVLAGQTQPTKDFTVVMESAGGFVGIPYWGCLLLINGMARATYHRCDALLTGLRGDAYDVDVFALFYRLLKSSKMMRRYDRKWPTIEAPLFNQPPELIHHIIKDDPLLAQTWSCNLPVACGKCTKCTVRAEKGIFHP